MNEQTTNGPCEKDREIAKLKEQISRLEKEKQTLEETVQWMHDLIWKMLKEQKQEK